MVAQQPEGDHVSTKQPSQLVNKEDLKQLSVELIDILRIKRRK